uniref:Uncharacterized protein n=1 Tax=Chrysotila carterae TaxID=13221 RepID=A0A7S4BDH1_CHRCT
MREGQSKSVWHWANGGVHCCGNGTRAGGGGGSGSGDGGVCGDGVCGVCGSGVGACVGTSAPWWASNPSMCARRVGGVRRCATRRLSLYHVRSPARGVSPASMAMAVWILLNNTLIKFGPATAVSLALNETPVVLRGPRHYASFVCSLLAVQLAPKDVVYAAAGRPQLRAVLTAAVALYKLRKACFVVEAVESLAPCSCPRLLLGAILMYLVIDGTGLARKATNVVTAGADGTAVVWSLRGCCYELISLVFAFERALRPNLLLLIVLLQESSEQLPEALASIPLNTYLQQ